MRLSFFVLLALLSVCSLPARAESGLKAPDALKLKWGEVKEEAITKYEKVRDSDLGQRVKRKAVEAKNSQASKNLWAKANEFWSRALAKGKSLLTQADRKLHETVLDPREPNEIRSGP